MFTEYNALKNGICPTFLSVHTEPLLGGPTNDRWDMILSNVPAKAEKPVLEILSPVLRNPSGRVLLVAVNPLANFFRSQIDKAEALLLHYERGKEHAVFIYGPTKAHTRPIQTEEYFFRRIPSITAAAVHTKWRRFPIP